MIYVFSEDVFSQTIVHLVEYYPAKTFTSRILCQSIRTASRFPGLPLLQDRPGLVEESGNYIPFTLLPGPVMHKVRNPPYSWAIALSVNATAVDITLNYSLLWIDLSPTILPTPRWSLLRLSLSSLGRQRCGKAAQANPCDFTNSMSSPYSPTGEQSPLPTRGPCTSHSGCTPAAISRSA